MLKQERINFGCSSEANQLDDRTGAWVLILVTIWKGLDRHPLIPEQTCLTPAPVDADSHLYLIDASGYIFRAYHALPPLTRKSDGLPVGAVAGFCNMLWKLLEDLRGGEKPTHFACVFDKSAITFRNALYDQYKAHRPEPPEDLIPQFPLVRRAAIAFGTPALETRRLRGG